MTTFLFISVIYLLKEKHFGVCTMQTSWGIKRDRQKGRQTEKEKERLKVTQKNLKMNDIKLEVFHQMKRFLHNLLSLI